MKIFVWKHLLLLVLFFATCFGSEASVDDVIEITSINDEKHNDEFVKLEKLSQSLNLKDSNDVVFNDFPDRPLQIVRPDDKHKGLEIVEENIKYLHRINGTVMTVSVVGKFHSGKSFLMNQLMQKSSGFGIGSKVTPETMGIWIWGNPIQMNDDKKEKQWILFLDTEGFAANNVSENYDAKIFAVASLLSSKLIYNSVKIIDQSDIDYLELLARRTQLFAHKSRMLPQKDIEDTITQDELLKFPHLLWVIQDFVQDTGNEECKSWLMRMLNTHTREEENYSISLKDIFPSVDCHTLFIPSAQKDLLHDLSKAQDNDLTSDYRSDRDRLLEKIRQLPQESHTKFYTGTQVAAVLRTLVNGANMGSMQNIPNRWDAFLDSLKQSSVEDCFKFYLSYLETDSDIAQGEPKPLEELNQLHELATEKAFDLLRHFLQGLGKSLSESSEDLGDLIKKHHVQIINDNNNKIRMKLISLGQQIEKQVYENFKSLKLPMLSIELEKYYEEQLKKVTDSFVGKVSNLVSRDELNPYISDIHKSLRLNLDSTLLSNREKLEKFFNQIIDKLVEKAFFQVKIDTEKPMIPEACYLLLNDISTLTLQQFYKKSDIFHKEKTVFENMVAKLQNSLNTQTAMILKDNEQAINIFLAKQSHRLVNEYDENISKYLPSFPMEPESLNENLERDSLRTKGVFSTDFSSYSTSPFFMENFNKFVFEVDKVTEKYQNENFKAYRQAVDEPLTLAKKVIMISAKQYQTQFSFYQFAKTICNLHLNDGKAKDWTPALKERIIALFFQEDNDLKAELESRAGFLSNIIGFFQWIWYWIFG